MCDSSLPDTKIRLHHPSPSGKTVGYSDPCIAPLVQTLNDGGFQTIASCCGHGRNFASNVLFEDGPTNPFGIMIFRTFQEWNEATAFLLGHNPDQISHARWEAFHREFSQRYKEAMEGHDRREANQYDMLKNNEHIH